MKLRSLFLVMVSIASLAMTVSAQTDDRDLAAAAAGNDYVVSVKPGGVNYVSGDVTIRRTDGTSGPLVKGERVEVNDVVETGLNGRVELMMNPGSYARLDSKSKFRFIETSLSRIEVEVISGSAIFEAYASNEFRVSVVAADAKYFLTKTGVFRVDVASATSSSIEVRKGFAQVGNLRATQVKKGRKAVVRGDNVSVAKFNRSRDSFEEWSRNRAKTIAKASQKFKNSVAARRLGNSYRGNLWNCYDSFGLWMYNPTIQSYGFLPFGSWRTPYGYRLRSVADICSMPWYVRDFYYGSRYRRYPRRNNDGNGNGGGTGGGGGTTGTVPEANVERARRTTTPPFRRMERTRSVRTQNSGRSRAGSGSTFPGSSTTTRSTNRRTTTRSTRSTKSSSRPATRTRSTTPPLRRTKSKIN